MTTCADAECAKMTQKASTLSEAHQIHFFVRKKAVHKDLDRM